MTAVLLQRPWAFVSAGMRLILSILVAVAVLLMPAGMMAGGAAIAATHDMTATAAVDHCAGRQEPDKEQPPERCCILACSTLPAESVALSAFLLPAPSHAAGAPAHLHGLSAEAATPPPRSPERSEEAL